VLVLTVESGGKKADHMTKKIKATKLTGETETKNVGTEAKTRTEQKIWAREPKDFGEENFGKVGPSGSPTLK